MMKLKCPSCDSELEPNAALCPRCRLNLRGLDLKFGAIPSHTRYVTDHAERLSASEIGKLCEELKVFERKFPQALFSVFVIALPQGESAREYAFWLANRGGFSPHEATGPDNFDILLVLDVSSGTAVLTVGYGLEQYLSEDDLNLILDAALPALRGNRLAEGIHLCIENMTARLRELARELAPAPGGEKMDEELWAAPA
jgi:uncharacterized membrane protein YgcG